MESYLATSWIDPATATARQKLMENVPTMEKTGKCVVYKATCKICNQSYIRQTQQKLKDHMGQHLNDVKKLVTKGTKSDSFASHFAHHCKKVGKPTSDELPKMMKVKIVWQGNAISCMKSFGKLNCSLCMRERIEILCTIHQEEWKIINHCTEVANLWCMPTQNEVSQVP
jgi:hypothetical protein